MNGLRVETSASHESIPMTSLRGSEPSGGSDGGAAFEQHMTRGSRADGPSSSGGQPGPSSHPGQGSEPVAAPASSTSGYHSFPPLTAPSSDGPSDHGSSVGGGSPSIAAPSVHGSNLGSAHNSLPANSNAGAGPDGRQDIAAGGSHVIQSRPNTVSLLGTNNGQVLNANNQGFSHLQTNLGNYSSVANGRNENVGVNYGTMNMAGSQGNHVVGTNHGHMDVGTLGPNAHVQVNNQHGTVTQHFPPSASNLWQGSSATYSPSLQGLRLDQHGSHDISNVVGNAGRHPLATVAAAITGGIGPAAIVTNNALAIPGSFHGSQQAFRPS